MTDAAEEKWGKYIQEMLTHNVEYPHVGDHGVRVYLAHVMSLVLLLHVLDVQTPRVVLVVGDGEPGDARYHLVVDGQDHLPVQVHKGNLEVVQVLDHTRDDGVAPHGHGDVGHGAHELRSGARTLPAAAAAAAAPGLCPAGEGEIVTASHGHCGRAPPPRSGRGVGAGVAAGGGQEEHKEQGWKKRKRIG